MNWWHYLLLANLYLALFYGFYLLLLRTETYFMLNRIYLVSAAILSFFIPMMQAEWVKNLFITQKVQQTIYYIDPGFVYQVSPAAESGFTISQLFTAVYWLVSMLLLARLIYRLFLLKRIINGNEFNSAFSFFGKVKVDENLPQKEIIEQHEMVHVAQLHSADVLLFEVLAILNWFNPVIYFYRKAIKYIHEFIADRDAISFGVDKADYALLLLSQSMGVQPNTLTNSFFNQSLLKQRIMMLHKNPSRRSALLKYGLSAPLFAAMLVLTSATVSKQKTIKVIADKIGSDALVKEVASDFKNEIGAPKKIASIIKSAVKTASTLKGKVVNVDGDPLSNVLIFYSKKSVDFKTDLNGNFTVSNYKEGDLLNFELYGYNNVAKSFVNVKEKLPIVVLQPYAVSINEVKGSVKFTKTGNDSTISFATVDKLPSFPGGEAGFGNYLAKSLRYPKVAKDSKITGRVIVTFIVERDGKLSNIKVLRDIGGGCGAEAVRVLEECPNWNPGQQSGKPVRVSYTMPVNFTLANNETTLYGKATTLRTVKFMNEDSVIKRAKALGLDKMDNMTMSGFGGKDSARQRPPADVVRIQSKMMGIDPIYMLDGKEVTKDVLNKTNPNDIESISVFKGSTATAKYGDKAKNGVVEITMKKGKKP